MNVEAMKAGRERAQAARRTAAIKRVAVFTAWLEDGSPSGSMPPVPSSADYRAAARGAERS